MLLPSELSRLIWDHLLHQEDPPCPAAAQTYLEESLNLREVNQLLRRRPDRRIDCQWRGKDLLAVIDDFSE